MRLRRPVHAVTTLAAAASAAAMLLLVAPGAAQAAIVDCSGANPNATTWTGAASPAHQTEWDDAGNWSNGAPTATSDVCLTATGTFSDISDVVGSLQVTGGAVDLTGSTIETRVDGIGVADAATLHSPDTLLYAVDDSLELGGAAAVVDDGGWVIDAIAGTGTWHQPDQIVSGTLSIPATIDVELSETLVVYTDVVASGDVTLTSGTAVIANGFSSWRIAPGGTLTAAAGATSRIEVPFENDGDVAVAGAGAQLVVGCGDAGGTDSGTWTAGADAQVSFVDRGTCVSAPCACDRSFEGATLAGAGTYRSSVPVTVKTGLTWSAAGSFDISDAALTADGTATLLGAAPVVRLLDTVAAGTPAIGGTGTNPTLVVPTGARVELPAESAVDALVDAHGRLDVVGVGAMTTAGAGAITVRAGGRLDFGSTAAGTTRVDARVRNEGTGAIAIGGDGDANADERILEFADAALTGGTLRMDDAVVRLSGGTSALTRDLVIDDAGSNGYLQLAGGTVALGGHAVSVPAGTALRTSGSGTIEGSGAISGAGTLALAGGSLGSSGDLDLAAGITVAQTGAVTAGGARDIDAAGSWSVTSGSLTLGGTANVTTAGTLTLAAGTQVSSAAPLHVAGDLVVTGAASATATVDAPLDVTGQVLVQGPRLTLGAAPVQLSGTALTGGTWLLTGGGRVKLATVATGLTQIDGSVVSLSGSGAGFLNAANGSALATLTSIGPGTYLTLLGGAGLPTTGTLALAGTLEGVGAIGGSVHQTGGVLSPGSPAAPIGTLAIGGNYDKSGGVLAIDLAQPPAPSDRVTVAGTAHVDGAVSVDASRYSSYSYADAFDYVVAGAVPTGAQVVAPLTLARPFALRNEFDATDERLTLDTSELDAAPPGAVAFARGSHAVRAASAAPQVTVTFDDAVDAGSGLAGYAYAWGTDAGTELPAVPALTPSPSGTQSLTSPVQSSSTELYLHVRAVDADGNWGATQHAGPFVIDLTAPTGTLAVAKTRTRGEFRLSGRVVDTGGAGAGVVSVGYSKPGASGSACVATPAAADGSWSCTWSAAKLPFGAYVLTATMTDGVGNSATAVATATTTDPRIGTPRGDAFTGTPCADTFRGLGGNDTFKGLGGNDTFDGGAGNDTADGGRGNDKLVGGAGNDKLTGGPGRDTLLGGPGKDVLNAKDGKPGDVVDCGAGKDVAKVDRGDKVRNCETVVR